MNLPKTAFPLRPSPADREPQLRSLISSELYKWQQVFNTGTDFVLHDGPPYANGKLHSGP